MLVQCKGFYWCSRTRQQLRGHVTDQVYVVIEVADKVVRDVVSRPARVPDELPLRHFVLDVRAGQVDGQQDQAVAQHVNRICTDRKCWSNDDDDMTTHRT